MTASSLSIVRMEAPSGPDGVPNWDREALGREVRPLAF